jgi:D-galactose 1-dehydrogenase
MAEMLDRHSHVEAAAICTPPAARFDAARAALASGKHVLLEKPPCSSMREIAELSALAASQRLTLFQAWHSRYAPAIAPAAAWLKERTVSRIDIVWKENWNEWHPGQRWIWNAGGFGVFDAGINAFSILTKLLPKRFMVQSAELQIPADSATPIAANLYLSVDGVAPVTAALDFGYSGPAVWELALATDCGRRLVISDGGAAMAIDGQNAQLVPPTEYRHVYDRFAYLIATGQSDVDTAAFALVLDALRRGTRTAVAPIHI